MNFYSKEAVLFLVQVDHLSGEILGDVVDSFYAAGAKNVQIISSITKKNRPSHIILVDSTSRFQEQIEAVIINECGSSGWHCINTCHRYTDVSIVTREVIIQTIERSFLFVAKGKKIADDMKSIRPEYDSCVELKNLLKEKAGVCVPVKKIQIALADMFHNEEIHELVF